MKLAMIGVARAMEQAKMQSKMIMQVHDELIIDTLESEARSVDIDADAFDATLVRGGLELDDGGIRRQHRTREVDGHPIRPSWTHEPK